MAQSSSVIVGILPAASPDSWRRSIRFELRWGTIWSPFQASRNTCRVRSYSNLPQRIVLVLILSGHTLCLQQIWRQSRELWLLWSGMQSWSCLPVELETEDAHNPNWLMQPREMIDQSVGGEKTWLLSQVCSDLKCRERQDGLIICCVGCGGCGGVNHYYLTVEEHIMPKRITLSGIRPVVTRRSEGILTAKKARCRHAKI